MFVPPALSNLFDSNGEVRRSLSVVSRLRLRLPKRSILDRLREHVPKGVGGWGKMKARLNVANSPLLRSLSVNGHGNR